MIEETESVFEKTISFVCAFFGVFDASDSGTQLSDVSMSWATSVYLLSVSTTLPYFWYVRNPNSSCKSYSTLKDTNT